MLRYLLIGFPVLLGISLSTAPVIAGDTDKGQLAFQGQPDSDEVDARTAFATQARAVFRTSPIVAESINSPLIVDQTGTSSLYLNQNSPASLKFNTVGDTNFARLFQFTTIQSQTATIASTSSSPEPTPTAPIADANTSLTATDLLADATIQDQEPSTPLPPITASEATSSSAGPASEATNKAGDTLTTAKNLAAQSQNPIANLTSVPFQNNTNFGVGQFNRTSNILNIQPVIPTSLGNKWNLINRVIIPVAYQPELAPGVGQNFGLGDITYQGYFVPKGTGKFTWGVGPVLLLPTATATSLGSGKWGAGPGFVGLVTTGKIVTGALVNNVWSFAGDSDRTGVSVMTIQPFFNYNFERGWYVSTAPIITANWLGEGQKWTLPIGGGFGRVFKIGKQPVNMALQAYWNAVKPEGAGDWTLRFQVNLLFPK